MGEERPNALPFVGIHRDIFLDYHNIIEIYAFKYPRRMLLINPLSKNRTVETFNARKTYKVYINFRILVYFLSL